MDFEQDFGGFFNLPTSIPGDAERDGFYVQVGAWVTEKIGLFAQYEETSIEDEEPLVPDLDDFHEELAVSLNYRFNVDLQARIEFHTADTRLPLGIPTTGGLVQDPEDVDWGIVALSVSF